MASPAKLGMIDSLEDVILARRSIREFRDEPVPRELIEDLLQLAIWAPSPHNAQPWRFTVLSPEAARQLADAMAARLASELLADGVELGAVQRQTERSRRRISTAPALILCSLVRDGLVVLPDARRNTLEFEMAVQSVGAVLQTLFLLAWQRGLGTCWMAAPMYCPDVVRNALDLPGENVPQALVLMGYPATIGRVRERRPLTELVDFR